jgi:hypothetical protein
MSITSLSTKGDAAMSADGTSIMLTDSRAAAIADAWEHRLRR